MYTKMLDEMDVLKSRSKVSNSTSTSTSKKNSKKKIIASKKRSKKKTSGKQVPDKRVPDKQLPVKASRETMKNGQRGKGKRRGRNEQVKEDVELSQLFQFLHNLTLNIPSEVQTVDIWKWLHSAFVQLCKNNEEFEKCKADDQSQSCKKQIWWLPLILKEDRISFYALGNVFYKILPGKDILPKEYCQNVRDVLDKMIVQKFADSTNALKEALIKQGIQVDTPTKVLTAIIMLSNVSLPPTREKKGKNLPVMPLAYMFSGPVGVAIGTATLETFVTAVFGVGAAITALTSIANNRDSPIKITGDNVISIPTQIEAGVANDLFSELLTKRPIPDLNVDVPSRTRTEITFPTLGELMSAKSVEKITSLYKQINSPDNNNNKQIILKDWSTIQTREELLENCIKIYFTAQVALGYNVEDTATWLTMVSDPNINNQVINVVKEYNEGLQILKDFQLDGFPTNYVYDLMLSNSDAQTFIITSALSIMTGPTLDSLFTYVNPKIALYLPRLDTPNLKSMVSRCLLPTLQTKYESIAWNVDFVVKSIHNLSAIGSTKLPELTFGGGDIVSDLNAIPITTVLLPPPNGQNPFVAYAKLQLTSAVAPFDIGITKQKLNDDVVNFFYPLKQISNREIVTNVNALPEVKDLLLSYNKSNVLQTSALRETVLQNIQKINVNDAKVQSALKLLYASQFSLSAQLKFPTIVKHVARMNIEQTAPDLNSISALDIATNLINLDKAKKIEITKFIGINPAKSSSSSTSSSVSTQPKKEKDAKEQEAQKEKEAKEKEAQKEKEAKEKQLQAEKEKEAKEQNELRKQIEEQKKKDEELKKIIQGESGQKALGATAALGVVLATTRLKRTAVGGKGEKEEGEETNEKGEKCLSRVDLVGMLNELDTREKEFNEINAEYMANRNYNEELKNKPECKLLKATLPYYGEETVRINYFPSRKDAKNDLDKLQREAEKLKGVKLQEANMEDFNEDIKTFKGAVKSFQEKYNHITLRTQSISL
jgi:hypothetical protein